MYCSSEVTTGHPHGTADKAGGGISESSFRKSIRHGLDVGSLYSAFYSWTLDEFKDHFSEFTMVQRTKWSLSRPDGLQPTPWLKEKTQLIWRNQPRRASLVTAQEKKGGKENYNTHGAHSLASIAHCNGSSGHTPFVLSCCGTLLELSVHPAKRSKAFP